MELGPILSRNKRKIAAGAAAFGIAFGAGALVDREFFPLTNIQMVHEGSTSNTNEKNSNEVSVSNNNDQTAVSGNPSVTPENSASNTNEASTDVTITP
jgi:hypothetical protein